MLQRQSQKKFLDRGGRWVLGIAFGAIAVVMLAIIVAETQFGPERGTTRTNSSRATSFNPDALKDGSLRLLGHRQVIFSGKDFTRTVDGQEFVHYGKNYENYKASF